MIGCDVTMYVIDTHTESDMLIRHRTDNVVVEPEPKANFVLHRLYYSGHPSYFSKNTDWKMFSNKIVVSFNDRVYSHTVATGILNTFKTRKFQILRFLCRRSSHIKICQLRALAVWA